MTEEKFNQIVDTLKGITVHDWYVVKERVDRSLQQCTIEDTERIKKRYSKNSGTGNSITKEITVKGSHHSE